MDHAHHAPESPPRATARIGRILVGAFIGLPVVLLLLLIVFPLLVPVVLVYALVERIHHLCLRRRLRRAGRLRNATERIAALRAEGGTLIADQFAPGWAVARLWATREDVRALGPQPPVVHHADLDAQAASPEFAKWCDDHCLDPERGSADLLDLSPRKAQRLWDQLTAAPAPFHTVLVYRAVEDEETIVCEGCGYDLTGNESRVCPECGMEAQAPAGR